MPNSEKKQRYIDEFNKIRYDTVNLRIAKGQRELWKAAADKNGESLNAYINRLVNTDIAAGNGGNTSGDNVSQ